MNLRADTIVGNRRLSERLIGMLVDFVNNTSAIFDSVKIRAQAYLEGLMILQQLLLKSYLVKGWGKDKARYILSEKPQVRKREQKKLLKIWPKLARMIVTMFLTILHLNTILWYQTSLIACRLVKYHNR